MICWPSAHRCRTCLRSTASASESTSGQQKGRGRSRRTCTKIRSYHIWLRKYARTSSWKVLTALRGGFALSTPLAPCGLSTPPAAGGNGGPVSGETDSSVDDWLTEGWIPGGGIVKCSLALSCADTARSKKLRTSSGSKGSVFRRRGSKGSGFQLGWSQERRAVSFYAYQR